VMDHVAPRTLVTALVLTGAVAIGFGYYIASRPLPSRAEDRARPEPVVPATAALRCDHLCQEAHTLTAEIHFTVEGSTPTGYICICLTDNVPLDME